MKNKKYDKSINRELFGLCYFNEFSDSVYEAKVELAEKTIKNYGDEIVFNEWFAYLETNVENRMDAWSFMSWFFNYGGHELVIKNPYPFLAALFSKLDLTLNSEPKTEEDNQIFDTFDSIYVSLLKKAGFVNDEEYFYINLYEDENFSRELAKLNTKNCPNCA